jgi:hypothetical protein
METLGNKKIEFGSKEPRKFTLTRDPKCPFVDISAIENPPSWKYQKAFEDSRSTLKMMSQEKAKPFNLTKKILNNSAQLIIEKNQKMK